MSSSAISEWAPILVLAALAIGMAVVLLRIRLPWFLGAPIAGVTSIVLFEVFVHLVLGESEKMLYVALVFGSIYATGFALIPYVGRFIFRKLHRT